MPKTNGLNDKVFKVFISSTFLDNQQRRQTVQDAILRAGMMPVGMERFTATTRPTVEECLRLVKEADVMVGIIAWRYGWIPPGQELSIIELEYGQAEQRLMFVIDSSVPVHPEQDFDDGPQRWEKQQKLEVFKKRINADQMPGRFMEENLGTVVMQALEQWRRQYQPDNAVDVTHTPPSGTTVQGDKNVVVEKGQYIGGHVGGDVIGPGATVIKGNVHIDAHDTDDPDQSARNGDTATNPSPKQLRLAYLKHLYHDTRHISLQSFAMEEAEKGQSLVELGAIYTALQTREVERSEDADRRGKADVEHMKERRFLSAVELANKQDRLVLLGDPGSGKSTFVRYLTLCMTGELLENEETNLASLVRPLVDDKDKPATAWNPGPLLPIFIQLRDFAVTALPAPGEKGSASHLWNYLDQCLQNWELSEYGAILRREVLDTKSQTLMLLDGLDEVPNPENQRQQIKEAVEDFAKTTSCRIIVTSRTYAYQKQDWTLTGFTPGELAPFNEAQIRCFIDQWYGYQSRTGQRDSEDAQGRARLLAEAVFEKNRRLQGLAERPLLLTLMAVLHSWHGRDLPEKRVDIYEQTLELLIHRWNSRKESLDRSGRDRLQDQDLSQWLRGGRAELRQLLERLAFEAHGREQSPEACADVPKMDLIYGLSQICKDQSIHPDKLEEYVKDRMGILIERGHEVFTFPHRTFQEYLAACYLTRTGFPKQIADLTRRDPQRWREVAHLVGLKVNTAHSVLALAERLSGKDWNEPDAWGTLIAGEFLAECDCCKQFDDFEQSQFETLRQRLIKVLEQSTLPALERALAGRVLAQLGDPREEVMIPEKIQFKKVPAGSFWMGAVDRDKDAYPDEKPGFENLLDYDYYLSRFPVSNAQYGCFVEAEGYQDKRYWQEAIADGRWDKGILSVYTLDRKESEYKQKKVSGPSDYGFPYNLKNHPVVGVSWYEAIAYCRWLTDYLKTVEGTAKSIMEKLEKGWCFTLPSETEWEKAARDAGDKRIYPWGNEPDKDKMNYSETEIGLTSALGCFPQGKSPFGCEDMAGNTDEWCRTPWQENYEEYENELKTISKVSSRVIRGGAFANSRYDVRCSYRNRNYPDLRDYHIGFRVSLSPFL